MRQAWISKSVHAHPIRESAHAARFFFVKENMLTQCQNSGIIQLLTLCQNF